MRNRRNIDLRDAVDPIVVDPQGVERPGLDGPLGDVMVSLFALRDFVGAVALTFVDHALRHGDSLVGLSRRQIEAFHWEVDAPGFDWLPRECRSLGG